MRAYEYNIATGEQIPVTKPVRFETLDGGCIEVRFAKDGFGLEIYGRGGGALQIIPRSSNVLSVQQLT
ncbi:MAG: hypothetical protein KGL39_10605 [Patescibacteria group bacterium]|nr:hypothetical protein [Patescibacteria group bacterium]